MCRKHQLTYYVEYGTLLGAVRHKGFIPWDDDIDVVMFRNDYMKLLSIGPEEFTDPYFFQNVYTDNMVWAFSKLRDSRTTAIEFPDMVDFNQGIFIDIFPLDDVPSPNADNRILFHMQKELWQTIIQPKAVLHSLEQKEQFLLPYDVLFDLLKMDIRQRMLEFERFNLTHFGQSEYINFIMFEFFNDSPSTKREWYQEVVYLPFENIQVPAPMCYKEILGRRYGNWHQFVQGGSLHEGRILFDPDIPYTKYIELYHKGAGISS